MQLHCCPTNYAGTRNTSQYSPLGSLLYSPAPYILLPRRKQLFAQAKNSSSGLTSLQFSSDMHWLGYRATPAGLHGVWCCTGSAAKPLRRLSGPHGSRVARLQSHASQFARFLVLHWLGCEATPAGFGTSRQQTGSAAEPLRRVCTVLGVAWLGCRASPRLLSVRKVNGCSKKRTSGRLT